MNDPCNSPSLNISTHATQFNHNKRVRLRRLVFAQWFFIALVVFAAQARAELPPDFQITQIIGIGLDGPSAFEFSPDGRIFILERTGTIKVFKGGVLLAQPFATLPSVASGDRGLIGIVFDPEFAINHFVYFYYTGSDLLNRVVRYDASTDVGSGLHILYQTSLPSESLHVGGSMRFGPDGKLYFAIGDNGDPLLAQQLDNPHGKILRISKDGSIPADNPFVGTSNALGEIWAYGFRNPWRFQFDSLTGRLYVGDVGNYTWEEINLVEKGLNYGWPIVEGTCLQSCEGLTDPIYAYNHNGGTAAITGGPVYRATQFPAEYRGALFFSDYGLGFIRYMMLDAQGRNAGVFDFDVNAGSVVDLKVASDGSLYYLTYFPGRIYRITYATGNHIPVAIAGSDLTKGIEPFTVHFTSTGSNDPDNDPLTFLWNFGDGTTSTQENPVKTYSTKGTYIAELTVSDGVNSAQALPIVIQAGVPPTVTISSPNEGDTYRAGDTIRYQAAALDGAGNDLNDAGIVTDVILHHDVHTHPFQDDLIGRTNAFTIPVTGEAAPNTWYEIRTTATDTSGLASTVSRNIFPLLADMQFDTVPAGLSISVDGTPYSTPHTVTGVVGTQRQISAKTIQERNDLVYTFDHWSDGLTQQHLINTPESFWQYTAYFSETTGYSAEYWSNPTLAGLPVLSRADANIDFNWESGSPGVEVPNDGFSARWRKTHTLSAGTYQFSVTADDGVRVKIDGTTIIDKFIDQTPTTYTAFVNLASGQHQIVVEYYERSGFASMRFGFVKTAEPAGYQAQYFNNSTLSGTPVLTRADAAIDFDFGAGSPAPAINVDNFSTRWTKTETLLAGTYNFTATADDGVRVIVDGVPVIDQFAYQAANTYFASQALTAGTHTIVVEYYEGFGGAEVRFDYAKASDPVDPGTGFTGEYFNNSTLSGAPVLTRADPAIDFDFGAGSPAPAINVNNFSARWTRTETLLAGTYDFTVTADDGVRVKIDDILIIDHFIDQAPTTYSATMALTAGAHTIVVEYYEAFGGASARLNYERTGP